MNRIFLLIFFIFVNLLCSAKEHKYTFIHTPDCNNISIIDVQSTDTSTIVMIEYKSLPGTPLYLSSHIYLEDEDCQRYYLRRIIGAERGKNFAPLTGNLNFSLEFARIPSRWEFFDLKSTEDSESEICIWGIHSRKTKVPKSFEYDDKYVYRDSKFTQTDKAVIKGHINHKDTVSRTDKMYAYPYPFTFLDYENNIDLYLKGILIDDNGDFEIEGNIGSPKWSYLSILDKSIPILIYPGDTLNVNINLQDPEHTVSYESAKGNDIMPNLLKADPQYTHIERERKRGHKAYLDELEKENDSILLELRVLTGYLKQKYHLSEFESHLLYLNLKGNIDNITMTRIAANFKKHYTDKKEDPFYFSEDDFLSFALSKECMRSHEFMHSINTDDYSYFILPANIATCNLISLPTISRTCHPSIDKYRKQIMEAYIGKRLEDEWIKRVGF